LTFTRVLGAKLVFLTFFPDNSIKQCQCQFQLGMLCKCS
jgi:hypothetical protein